MNRTTRILTTGGIAAALSLIAAPVMATEPDVEVFWAMPEGASDTNVLWPQTYFAGDALNCGVWYQVDLYPADAVDGLIADGVLTDGEDHGIVKSWRFVYGGDCEVVPPVEPPSEEEPPVVVPPLEETPVVVQPVEPPAGIGEPDGPNYPVPPAVESSAPLSAAPLVTQVVEPAETLAATGPVAGWLVPVGGALLIVGVLSFVLTRIWSRTETKGSGS